MFQKIESIVKLVEGEHFGTKARADRLGVFGESASYFAAAREAIIHARKQVILVGWDFNTEIDLVRGREPGTDAPTKLGELLSFVLENNKELEIYILIWDFSMVYAFERQWRAFSKTLRDPHPRLHFRYDNQLPTGASHHQKILVIDDALGFSGGIDLSVWRWDTREHFIGDESRTDPEGDPFAPYHDVHYVVTGEAQAALREICVSRWKRATGEALPDCSQEDEHSSGPAFPSGLVAETEDTKVLFARTCAAWKGEPNILEIEKLQLELIRNSGKYLYFENQYFSSNRIGEAILQRIEDSDGPEVVIVLNDDTEGAMEEVTMGKMRDYWFRKFKNADKNNRVRMLYPIVQQEEGDSVRVYVHAKVFLCDDRILKIGSANLSNRSMRVDTELDLAIVEKASDGFIRSVRNSLLGGHLGVSNEDFENAFDTGEGLVAAIDSCKNNKGRTFSEISCRELDPLTKELTEEQILDPDEPIDPRSWVGSRIYVGERSGIRRRMKMVGVVTAALLLLALALKYGWGGLVDQNTVTSWIEAIRSAPYSPLILAGLFLVAGLVGFPLNAILIVSSLVLGPWTAFLSGYVGSHASAFATFGIGRVFGSRLLEKIDSDMIQRIDERLNRRGILAVVLLRIVPVAPFMIVNLAAGSSRITQRDFHLGTILGMAPGMLLVSFLSNQIESVIRNPDGGSLVWLGALLLVLGAGVWIVFKGGSGGSVSSRAKSSRSL